MKIPLSVTNKIIVSRRPILCEIEPAMAPPLWKEGNEYWMNKGKAGVRDARDGSDIANDCCDD